MKEVVNKTQRLLVFDLNSFNREGQTNAIYLSARESRTVEDKEALSKSLVSAEAKGLIAINDVKSSKKAEKAAKEEVKEEPAKEEAPQEDESADDGDEEKEKSKGSKSKKKKSKKGK